MATNTKPSKPTTELDFSKVFATNSSIQSFTWLDSEYLKGWEAIQMTPPARQQFDALQAHSDKKENWLYNQYLEGYVDKYLDYLDTVKAPINSPTFTGDPKAPTPSKSDNDTSIATTAFVHTWVEDIIKRIEDIDGGEGGGGGNGIGITDYGSVYFYWDNLLLMQWAECETNSSGMGTVNWPVSFNEIDGGMGDYFTSGLVRLSNFGDTPVITFNRTNAYYSADRCTCQVLYADGTPCSGKIIDLLAWGNPG